MADPVGDDGASAPASLAAGSAVARWSRTSLPFAAANAASAAASAAAAAAAALSGASAGGGGSAGPDDRARPPPALRRSSSRASSTRLASPGGAVGDDEERQCWICFATDADAEPGLTWVHPCLCKGDTKWVHEECLLLWIDEKQAQRQVQGSSGQLVVRCPQCQHSYVLAQPRPSPLLQLADRVNDVINVTFPYVAVTGLLYCGYISSITYGFYAMVQLLGPEQADQLLWAEQWGWRLYVGLPMIPLGLILSRFEVFDVFLPVLPLIVLHPRDIVFSWPLNPSTIVALLPGVCPWLPFPLRRRRSLTQACYVRAAAVVHGLS